MRFMTEMAVTSGFPGIPKITEMFRVLALWSNKTCGSTPENIVNNTTTVEPLEYLQSVLKIREKNS
jgi:hypothetical protein